MPETFKQSEQVRLLLDEAVAIASSSRDLIEDAIPRARLLQLSRQITGLLVQPDEAVADVGHAAGRHMCVRIADDLDLFSLIAEQPRTVRELAATTGAQEALVVRLMRMMVAIGFATQDDGRRYSATATTKQMTLPSVRAGMKLNFEQAFDAILHTPEYLKRNGYRLPQTMTDTPFQWVHKTDLPNHDYWFQRPEIVERFQTFMNGLYGGPAQAQWWTWYPIQHVLAEVTDQGVAFVDIAGGRGHQTEGVLKACPDVRGRFVSQDLPEVITAIQILDERIERMPHNFLVQQQDLVRGARVFLLSNILHDHPNDVCKQILGNIKPAMTPGYSKLLISNIILSEDNPPLRQLDMDISMLFLSGGAQRTEMEWQTLLQSADFHNVSFWHPPGDQNGIIEAEVTQ